MGTKPRKRRTSADWEKLAHASIRDLVNAAREHPVLKTRVPMGAVQVEILLISREEKMATLNYKFRKKKGATDILSFPSGKVFFAQGHLGELVICLPVMKRQAKEYKIDPELELYVLLTHGLLHLLGYDHEKSSREEKLMADLEKSLLALAAPTSFGLKQGLIARVT